MLYYKTKIYQDDLDAAIQHVIGREQLYGKRILITGCTGTIGSFLTDMLVRMNESLDAGIHIYAAGRTPEKIYRRFTEAGQIPAAAEFLTAVPYELSKDICFDCDTDYVIHAAGNAHPAAFNSDPVGTLTDAVNGTVKLLEYGMQHGAVRFLYLSSGEVYSNVDSMTFRACYPVSKMAGENLCASYAELGKMKTVVARSCHTFGPGMTKTDSRAHAQFLRNALACENIVLKSRGAQERSYLYVADCASALCTILVNGRTGEAYDVAAPDNAITVAGLAGLISDLSGCRLQYTEPSGQDTRDFSPISRQVLDGTQLNALGWKAAFSIEDGMRHTLEILKQSR